MPTSSALAAVSPSSPILTWISSAPSTTWALVRMWPSSSITKPEPVAAPPGWRAWMKTTPSESRS